MLHTSQIQSGGAELGVGVVLVGVVLVGVEQACMWREKCLTQLHAHFI